MSIIKYYKFIISASIGINDIGWKTNIGIIIKIGWVRVTLVKLTRTRGNGRVDKSIISIK